MGAREFILSVADRLIHPDGHANVMGVFEGHEQCIEGIHRLREAGFEKLIVHSPAPSHEIEEALSKGPSPVRWFTLVGGVSGGLTGFLLASLTSLEWNLVTSGKPIVSVPAYLIPTFELTILFGAIFTLIGFLLTSRTPQPGLSELYSEAFGEDRFGIGIVMGTDEGIEQSESALRQAGATEVYRAQG